MSVADERTRAERVSDLAEDLGVDLDAIHGAEAPDRFMVVQQYADTGRGEQFAIALGDDLAALMSRAQNEVWDGWIAIEVQDLDTGARSGVRAKLHHQPLATGTRA